jgi:hypothetical protein
MLSKIAATRIPIAPGHTGLPKWLKLGNKFTATRLPRLAHD